MAASEEPKFPFGNLLKDRPRAMLAAFGRRRLLEADERSSCALLGYEQGQLTSRGLNDLADLTVGQWSAALPGQEGEESDPRSLRHDGEVVAARVVSAGRFENYVDPLGVLSRERPLRAKERNEDKSTPSHAFDGALLDAGSGLMILCGSEYSPSHLKCAVGQMLISGSRKLARVSTFERSHQVGNASETRSAVVGITSPPPCDRHEDGPRVCFEKVTW